MRFIPQHDLSDCGPACIAMIANHYGFDIGVTKLRDLSGTLNSGTTIAGMIKAAHILNLSARPVKSGVENFNEQIPTPFIALNRIDGLNHFVVIKKIGTKYVHYIDPGQGKKKKISADFLKHWTGILILISPMDEFKLVANTKRGLKQFFPLLKPHIGTILKAILASLVLTLLGLFGAFYFSYLIDEVLPSKSESALHILSLGIILLTFFQVTLGAIRGQMLLHFSLKTSLTLNFSYLKHVLSQSMKFFDSRKVGEILSRLGDGAKIRGLLSNAALSVVMDIFMMIIAGIFLLSQNPLLFLIAVAAVPLSTAVIWGFARFFRENYRTSMGQEAESQSFLVETLNGMATLKGLNATDRAFEEVEKRLMKVTKTGYKGAIMGNIQGVIVGLIDGWAGNILFWLGSYFILKDQMTLGSLLAFNALLGYFLGPLKRLLGLQTAIQEALVAADRLGEIMELPPEFDHERTLLKPLSFLGKYEFKNLNFRYGSKKLILENLNLSIDSGTKVAFVGPSGCGKSTLIKLLVKFYIPESGDLFLDEHNILDVDTGHLRSRIGYVPQEVFLFSGSIRENLSLHKPDANFEEIVEAAKRAQAHEFITEMPERYETVLAERGFSLSGGERQRLALARALLGRPDILVFDEATSNLDVITEKAIHETIRDLANEGLTTILVAHRLATVVSCDKIFVMEKGKILEEGNHFELVKRGGAYTKLWEYQKL